MKRTHYTTTRLALFAAVATMGAASIAAKPASAQQYQIQIAQLDTDIDGQITQFSGWGKIEVNYEGQEDILYFNLSLDDRWVIENMPLLSPAGEGEPNFAYYNVDLGVPHGEPVMEVNFGCWLTPFTVEEQPPADAQMPVFADVLEINSGVGGPGDGPMFIGNPRGRRLVGGRVRRAAKGKVEIPNQDCGPNECAPAAVSNSLQYLNTRFNLGIDDDDISIKTLKHALNWTRSGAVPYTWPTLKAAYLEEKHIPVNSTNLEPGRNGKEAKRVLRRLIRARRRNCMIEMTLGPETENGRGHTVVLTKIADLGKGKFAFTIKHDNKQKKVGGTETIEITYDAGKRKITGGALSTRKVKSFTIQCRKRRR